VLYPFGLCLNDIFLVNIVPPPLKPLLVVFKKDKMQFKSVILNLIISTALIGCASPMQKADQEAKKQQLNTPVEVKITVPFDEAQAKTAMELGSTNIKGVLYHKVSSGGKNAGSDAPFTLSPAVNLKNVNVYLYPVTAHLLELNRLENENKNRFSPFSKDKQLKHFIPDSRIFKYALHSKTDDYGRYFFKSLKPGRYYILAENQNITSGGSETVPDGVGVVSNGWGVPVGTVQHYRNQNFNVSTVVEYEEFVEIKAGQKELVLESRMRRPMRLIPKEYR